MFTVLTTGRMGQFLDDLDVRLYILSLKPFHCRILITLYTDFGTRCRLFVSRFGP